MEEEEIKSYRYSNTTLCNVDSTTSDENKTSNSIGKSIWKTIIEESRTKSDFSKDVEDQIVPQNSDWQYLEDNIFPTLIPLLEKTLLKAIQMKCLKNQKNLFNGIDFISEVLWNTNKKYPERIEKKLSIYQMPWVQKWLEKHPRPVFPKAWLWSPEIAAVKIQSYMRGYFVRRNEEVQEMRQFWKILAIEKKSFRKKNNLKQ